MKFSSRLELRQSQSLVMTPQLLQAIKLLQMSAQELDVFIDAELERNPLLEVGPDTDNEPVTINAPAPDSIIGDDAEWEQKPIDPTRGEIDPRAESNVDQDDPYDGSVGDAPHLNSQALSATDWHEPRMQGFDESESIFDTLADMPPSLRDHLTAQLHLASGDTVVHRIGEALIDMIDDAGYIREPLADLAERLGVSVERTNIVRALITRFDPVGVGAIDLRECLEIQLREKDRLDPMIKIFLDHLELVGRRDFQQLKKLCAATDDDIKDMLAELKSLNPKPGAGFEPIRIEPAIPDVFIRKSADGSWQIELNSATMPKLLINQTYAAIVQKSARNDMEKQFVSDALQTANWLVRSLDQRAKTILKVASEIVAQQELFFSYGIEYLKPLNLRMVADAISVHESTVSRVTAKKYLACERGLFEMKYFFTASIAATRSGAESHSAEAVRHRIKQMIDQETSDDVLSDDTIVQRLKISGIDIARRTVAKYRESLRIPSSVERRREKQTAPRDLAPRHAMMSTSQSDPLE